MRYTSYVVLIRTSIRIFSIYIISDLTIVLHLFMLYVCSNTRDDLQCGKDVHCEYVLKYTDVIYIAVSYFCMLKALTR